MTDGLTTGLVESPQDDILLFNLPCFGPVVFRLEAFGGAQILFLLLHSDELAGLTPLERRRAKRKLRAEQQKQEELELEQQQAEEALVKPGGTVTCCCVFGGTRHDMKGSLSSGSDVLCIVHLS